MVRGNNKQGILGSFLLLPVFYLATLLVFIVANIPRAIAIAPSRPSVPIGVSGTTKIKSGISSFSEFAGGISSGGCVGLLPKA